MPQWSIPSIQKSLQKSLLNLLRPPREAVKISPRQHADTIRVILDSFAADVKEEPDESLKQLFSDTIEEFRDRLESELDRIEREEQEQRKKWKKGNKREIENIGAALDRMEHEIEKEEERYQVQSLKSANRRSKNPMAQPDWVKLLDVDDLELSDWRPPEHEMQKPELYTAPNDTMSLSNSMQTPEIKARRKAMKARWGAIVGWAGSGQEWVIDAFPFFPDRARWKEGRFIAEGSFGCVSVAAILGDRPQKDEKATRILAFKQIKTTSYSQDRRDLLLSHSRALLRAAKHPHVVTVVGCDNTEGEHRLFMEYVSGGSIRTMTTYLTHMTELEAIPIIRQIAKGLQHLHGLGIVHRDLKGENILVSLAGCVKICDLDTAKETSQPEHAWQEENGEDQSKGPKTVFGTPNWMSPEAALGRFSTRADVWSFGCVVIEILEAKRPWELKKPKEIIADLIRMNETGEVSAPSLPERLGELGKTVLTEMIFVTFDEREPVTKILEHKWLNGSKEVTSTPADPPEEVDINEVVGPIDDKPLKS